MKRRTAWVLVAAVAAVSVGAAAVGAVALLMRSGGGPAWGGPRYLRIGVEGEIPENPSAEFGFLMERRPVALRTLVESLGRARNDPKIGSVLLRIGPVEVGWGRVQELRDALELFRGSGKPIYAHVEFVGNKEYYLASACDRIYAVPTAVLDVSGLAAEVTFLKKTLDKLGIEAQFEGVGRYKNAPNQYTEAGFTEPHREQTESLLDSFFEQYVTGIASGRGITREEVLTLLEAGPYDAERALEAGLVDELLYRDEVEARVEGDEAVAPGEYTRGGGGFGLLGQPVLALVYVVGEIVPGESTDGPFGGDGLAGSDTVTRALRAAREDDEVRAVVLRVDSPGGSGTASDVIWREVALTREVKPVVVSMGDVAASGGYYVAMGADRIFAEPGTLTGSIGVFGGKFALRGLYDKIGLTREVVKRGEHADMFSEYRPWNAEERARFRALMESFYDEFIRKAAEGRGTTAEEVHAVAEGRVFTGAQALEVGLVDELGGLRDALEVAKQRAGVDPDAAVRVRVLPEPKGLLDMLLESQPAALARGLPPELRRAARWGYVLSRGGPLARLPFELGVR